MEKYLFFPYIDQQMFVEAVPLSAIAAEVGTPFYCYSSAAIIANYQAYQQAFRFQPALICYAVKANANQAVLATLAALGAGADVVSGGEIRRALAAGMTADKLVFSGVAKTGADIEYALSEGVLQFNVESEPELMAISAQARRLGREAAIALRINPDVCAGTHDKITTGRADNKFGIPIDQARALYAKAAALPGIRIQGVDVHIGSQLTDLRPFAQAFVRVAELVAQLRSDGHTIHIIDIGGGLGIDYGDGAIPPSVVDYAALALRELGHLDCRLVVEPGRSLVGDVGILVARVVYIKPGQQRRYLILDAAMNDLIRPSMYDAYHHIWPVAKTRTARTVYDVVGPVCESGDTFATQRAMAVCEAGDLLAIMDCGAYGAAMASSYNSRPVAAEVMVRESQFQLVRPRQDIEQLIGLERLPDWLAGH